MGSSFHFRTLAENGWGVQHIGIVVNQKSPSTGRYLVEHNIGAGPRIEDSLFSWRITGHYRYFGPAANAR